MEIDSRVSGCCFGMDSRYWVGFFGFVGSCCFFIF